MERKSIIRNQVKFNIILCLSIIMIYGLCVFACADFFDGFDYANRTQMQSNWAGYGGVPTYSTFSNSSVTITPPYGSTSNITYTNTGRYGKYTARFKTTNNNSNNVYFGWMSRDPWANPAIYVRLYGTFKLTVKNGANVDTSLQTPFVTTDKFHTVSIVWEPGSVELIYDGKSCGKVTNIACIPTTEMPLIIDSTRNLTAALQFSIDEIDVKPLTSTFYDEFDYTSANDLQAVWSGYGGLPAWATLNNSVLTLTPPSNSESRLTTGYVGAFGRLTARFMTTNDPGNYFYLGWNSRDPWGNPSVSVSLYNTLHLVVGSPGYSNSSIESPVVTANTWHTVSIVWEPGRVEMIYDGVSCGSVTDNVHVPNTALPIIVDVYRTLSASQEVKIDHINVQPLPSYSGTFHLTDGKPFFPLFSWYGYPVGQLYSAPLPSILIPDPKMDEMRDIGFNMMRYYLFDGINKITNDDITHASEHGLKTMLSVDWSMWDNQISKDQNSPTYNPTFKNDIDARKNNPGLFGYETIDEPMHAYNTWMSHDNPIWANLSDTNLSAGRDLMHDLDGKRPLLYNEAWPGAYNGEYFGVTGQATYTDYLSIGDAYSIDFYPYSLDYYRDMDLNGMSILTDLMRHCVNKKFGEDRPLYFTLQGSSWSEMGFPTDGTIHGTFIQQRLSSYQMIIHGMQGLTWFALCNMDLTNPDTATAWTAIKKVVSELGALQNVLAGGETVDSIFPPCRYITGEVLYEDPSGNVTTDPVGNTLLDDFSLQKGIITLGNANLEAILKVYNGQKYLIVVNTSMNQLYNVSISVNGWKAAKTPVLFESRGVISSPSGVWTDSFAKQEVHVYTDRRIAKNDYDGDGKSDFIVYDPVGYWHVLTSSTGWILSPHPTVIFGGAPNDQPFAADYDGDGKIDLGIRNSSNKWTIKKSTTNWTTSFNRTYGSGYPMALGDVDADGKADIIEFQNRTNWKVLKSSLNWFTPEMNIAFGDGNTGSIPVTGDFDGDRITDVAYYRNGTLNICKSSSGFTSSVSYTFGYVSGDKPVVGDFDGDGKDDPAIFRNGEWRIFIGSNSTWKVLYCGGATGDIPITGDFDGDGISDIGVYNTGSWRIALSGRDWSNSDTLVLARSFGATGFVPVDDFSHKLTSIQGTVVLENYTGNITDVPVTVKLNGTSYNLNLAADGKFTIPNVVEGTYDILIKAPHWLAKAINGVNATGTTNIGVVNVINGDVVDNNEIDFSDINAVRAAYGSFPGDTTWNDRADVDGSGEVDFSDINIVRSKYGEIGD